MKEILKNTYNKFRLKYDFYRRTRAYRKRYKKISKNLFSKDIEQSQLDLYKEKWSVLGQKIEIETLLLSYNLSGRLDLNIVPENIFSVLIERKLNPYAESKFYEIKNVYSKMALQSLFPKCYIHKIGGLYYDSEFSIIRNINEFLNEIKDVFPLVVKSSRDTFGGKDVSVVHTIEELKSSLRKYEFLVCEELIIQDSQLSKINNSSLNTIRTCLYRKKTGEFVVLNNSIRFGVNGSLDNETSGGIVCNIDDEGYLNEYAVDKYANKHFCHPDSKVPFANIHIPKYQELNATAKEIANEVLLGRLISLDMCLDDAGKWRCIEVNMFGQTIRFAQYAGRGFFGEHTSEVIDYVRASRP